MIEQVLPPAALSAEAFGDAVALPLVVEDERVLAAGAVPARSAEFATRRTLARSASRRPGAPPVAVLRDAQGGPVWPAGVVGSLTHCTGYRAAVVARAAAVPALGVDAEPARPLPECLLNVVALPDELSRLRRLAATAPGRVGTGCSSAPRRRSQGVVTADRRLAAPRRPRRHPPARHAVGRGPRAGSDVEGAPVGGFTGRWLDWTATACSWSR